MARAPKDRTGEKRGKLTIVSELPSRSTSWCKNIRGWRCKCDCGNTTVVWANNLNATISCGCVRAEQLAKRRATPEWKAAQRLGTIKAIHRKQRGAVDDRIGDILDGKEVAEL